MPQCWYIDLGRIGQTCLYICAAESVQTRPQHLYKLNDSVSSFFVKNSILMLKKLSMDVKVVTSWSIDKIINFFRVIKSTLLAFNTRISLSRRPNNETPSV